MLFRSKEYQTGYKEGMYIGMGAKGIAFASMDAEEPAKFYIISAPCMPVNQDFFEIINHFLV